MYDTYFMRVSLFPRVLSDAKGGAVWLPSRPMRADGDPVTFVPIRVPFVVFGGCWCYWRVGSLIRREPRGGGGLCSATGVFFSRVRGSRVS